MSARSTLGAVLLAFALAACGGGDPLKGVDEAIKAGDFAKAEAQLDAVALEKPELKAARAYRFALYRHLSVHGPADKQPAYLQKCIAEYDRLAQALGLKPDYANMEESLRGHPEGAALLRTARAPLYGE